MTLDNVKLIIGVAANDTSKDALLGLLIAKAEAEFMQVTNRTTVPDAAQNIIEQMAVLRFNMLGNEGLGSQSYSGHSESYQYPASLLKAINRFRKVVLV